MSILLVVSVFVDCSKLATDCLLRRSPTRPIMFVDYDPGWPNLLYHCHLLFHKAV